MINESCETELIKRNMTIFFSFQQNKLQVRQKWFSEKTKYTLTFYPLKFIYCTVVLINDSVCSIILLMFILISMIILKLGERLDIVFIG